MERVKDFIKKFGEEGEEEDGLKSKIAEVYLRKKFSELLEEFNNIPESVRMLCKMRAIEVLKRTARFFESHVASGKYEIIKDFNCDNPALMIRIILVDEES